jgi:hypothetical protein
MQEGDGEVDQQREGDQPADDVGDHSESSPRNVSASSAKPPISSSA